MRKLPTDPGSSIFELFRSPEVSCGQMQGVVQQPMFTTLMKDGTSEGLPGLRTPWGVGDPDPMSLEGNVGTTAEIISGQSFKRIKFFEGSFSCGGTRTGDRRYVPPSKGTNSGLS